MDIKYWSEFEISIMREERDYGIVCYERAIWKISWLRYWSVIQVNSHYAYLATEYIPQACGNNNIKANVLIILIKLPLLEVSIKDPTWKTFATNPDAFQYAITA